LKCKAKDDVDCARSAACRDNGNCRADMGACALGGHATETNGFVHCGNQCLVYGRCTIDGEGHCIKCTDPAPPRVARWGQGTDHLTPRAARMGQGIEAEGLVLCIFCPEGAIATRILAHLKLPIKAEGFLSVARSRSS
jgi:hypothetical protein